MLEEYRQGGRQADAPDGPLVQGMSICLCCEDTLAVYHDLTSRGVDSTRPFVGNGLWVTSVTDPDGYRLDFESRTDVPLRISD
jgi:lactoylglutathione lyase